MSRELRGMSSMSRIIAATLGVWMHAFIMGCVMHETYGNHALPESELAVVEGYWHYQVLYDEELHIASIDGKRESGRSGWPYAYSVSLPSGRHWLQLAILRNSGEIARCAFEWTFGVSIATSCSASTMTNFCLRTRRHRLSRPRYQWS